VIRFEWDPQKARGNLKKHGVSFEEASTVFFESPHVFLDPDHSDDEDRLVAFGYSHRHRVLMVVHCYLEGADVIRIISARKATKKEKKNYLGEYT
jgi:uncharacterized DUF497 family protein